MDVIDFKTRIDRFPAAWQAKCVLVYTKRKEIGELQERISKIEFATKRDVLNMSAEEDHKKDLSNAEKRNAKFDELLVTNDIYKRAQSDAQALRDSVALLDIEVKASKFRFDADMALFNALNTR